MGKQVLLREGEVYLCTKECGAPSGGSCIGRLTSYSSTLLQEGEDRPYYYLEIESTLHNTRGNVDIESRCSPPICYLRDLTLEELLELD